VPFVSEGAFGRVPFGGGRNHQGAVVSASTFGPDFYQRLAPLVEAAVANLCVPPPPPPPPRRHRGASASQTWAACRAPTLSSWSPRPSTPRAAGARPLTPRARRFASSSTTSPVLCPRGGRIGFEIELRKGELRRTQRS
jgi:hypothetical protein